MEISFIVALAALTYAFLLYPLLTIAMAKIVKTHSHENNDNTPSVSVVIAMRNEENHAKDRINNLYANQYRTNLFEVIVILDAPDDNTEKILRNLKYDNLHVKVMPRRSGKATCINLGVKMATGEIVVFCDARQRFEPKAIQNLVRWFDDPTVGAVGGTIKIKDGELGSYWKIETTLRKAESKLGSTMGCSGAIYAIRRDAFEAIPDDTILDDVVIPMQITTKGYTVKFDENAVALDPQPASVYFETRRKIRTLAGNWQMAARYASWLLPWRNRYAFQLISHKYARLMGPYLMATVFVANLALSKSDIYRCILGAQFIFYFMAALGLAYPSIKSSPVRIASTFVYLNWLNALALPTWLSGKYKNGWQA